MIVKKKIPIKSYEIFSESDYQGYRQPLVKVVALEWISSKYHERNFKTWNS
jgi:hypothetical protein